MTLGAEVHDGLLSAGQGHVLKHLARLDSSGRARLEQELAGLDLPLIRELSGLIRKETHQARSFAPPELFPLRQALLRADG